ncbi:hypothetical protein MRB53_021615 [Persea americana]|uniref:Uncharacterized protein n=1 Tax=Persea americana TaxID=3435 RepID=A0ACC2L4M4_PERAE|nr:hypothetical protein MRB53_021615 [Persea americana]
MQNSLSKKHGSKLELVLLKCPGKISFGTSRALSRRRVESLCDATRHGWSKHVPRSDPSVSFDDNGTATIGEVVRQRLPSSGPEPETIAPASLSATALRGMTSGTLLLWQREDWPNTLSPFIYPEIQSEKISSSSPEAIFKWN